MRVGLSVQYNLAAYGDRDRYGDRKKKHVLGNVAPVLGMKLTGVESILVIFQLRPTVSHMNGKLSPRPVE